MLSVELFREVLAQRWRVWFRCSMLLLMSSTVLAQSDSQACDVDRVKREMTSAPSSLMSALFSSAISSTRCSSMVSVMRLAGSSPRVGGRKLEGDKALDPVAAQQERQAAANDPAFATALATELAGETDPVRRLLREAAMLHDHGHYMARDLLIAQLRGGASK